MYSIVLCICNNCYRNTDLNLLYTHAGAPEKFHYHNGPYITKQQLIDSGSRTTASSLMPQLIIPQNNIQ